MTNMKTKKRKKNKKGIFFIITALLVGFVIFQMTNTSLQNIASEDPKDSLQIGAFYPIQQKTETENQRTIQKPDPQINPPAKNLPVCSHDTGKSLVNSGEEFDPNSTCSCMAWVIECKEEKCVQIINDAYYPNTPKIPGICNSFGNNKHEDIFDTWCSSDNLVNNGTGIYCVGKPIIYLYPEAPTYVNVEIQTIGNIFISDPHYPEEKGWQNVLAYPNGNLSYQGKQYRELFYETDVDDFQKPNNGINISKENIEPELKQILTRLGLNEFERSEFMDFWIPILENQNKPNIQFSLITGEAKDEIDKVIIEPKPDTFIEILVYFKPLDKPFQGSTLNLPENPPVRVGFTAVEWGGVLDEN